MGICSLDIALSFPCWYFLLLMVVVPHQTTKFMCWTQVSVRATSNIWKNSPAEIDESISSYANSNWLFLSKTRKVWLLLYYQQIWHIWHVTHNATTPSLYLRSFRMVNYYEYLVISIEFIIYSQHKISNLFCLLRFTLSFTHTQICIWYMDRFIHLCWTFFKYLRLRER